MLMLGHTHHLCDRDLGPVLRNLGEEVKARRELTAEPVVSASPVGGVTAKKLQSASFGVVNCRGRFDGIGAVGTARVTRAKKHAAAGGSARV